MSEIKSYREIEWKTVSDLAKRLGISRHSYYQFIAHNPDKGEVDYIDLRLGECSYEEYVERGYRGGKKYKGLVWESLGELSALLGLKQSTKPSRYWGDKQDKPKYGALAEKEYIDMSLKDCSYEEYVARGFKGVYKCCGLEWSKQSELAEKLGVSQTEICMWKKINNKNDKDYLVMKLDGITYEEYFANVIGKRSFKRYRGIVWNDRKEMADMLKRSYWTISNWITKNKAKEEDYIDLLFKDCTYEEYIENGYKGCFKHCGFSWNNQKELAEKLNIPLTTMRYWIRKNSGKTERDYIDYYLQKKGVRVS